MKRWVIRIARSFAVIVGIIVLTSFTIDATDALNGSQSALSIFAKKVAETGCPSGMVQLDFADRSLCIDVYENSFAETCPHVRPGSAADTQRNVNDVDCSSVSQSKAIPAVFVTFHQAQNFCARRGGRLPNSYEWYDAALGTPDVNNGCNLNGSLTGAGVYEQCISARGAYDMIGNAWEWVDGQVVDGVLDGVALPPNGYVSEADRAGVAVRTENSPNELFNKDYFWSLPRGSLVMMRGGFYSSGTDGGLYSIHADIEPSFTSTAVGFRCVIDK